MPDEAGERLVESVKEVDGDPLTVTDCEAQLEDVCDVVSRGVTDELPLLLLDALLVTQTVMLMKDDLDTLLLGVVERLLETEPLLEWVGVAEAQTDMVGVSDDEKETDGVVDMD